MLVSGFLCGSKMGMFTGVAIPISSGGKLSPSKKTCAREKKIISWLKEQGAGNAQEIAVGLGMEVREINPYLINLRKQKKIIRDNEGYYSLLI